MAPHVICFISLPFFPPLCIHFTISGLSNLYTAMNATLDMLYKYNPHISYTV